MILAILSFGLGLGLLSWGASSTVDRAISLAKHLQLSPAVIAATLIAFGTSLPELIVSANAAIRGDSAIAIGNAMGSNLANMGLVLGLCLLFRALPVTVVALRSALPLMLIATLFGGLLLLNDAKLSRIEGALLLLLLIPGVFWLLRSDAGPDSVSADRDRAGALRNIFLLCFALLLLNLGAELLLYGAEFIADSFGFSSFVIGVSLLAVGTSLPELMVSVAGIWRGHSDLAVGNIAGSNFFNLCAVMGFSALIHPWQALSATLLWRDYSVMAALSIAPLLWIGVLRLRAGDTALILPRWLGILLLTSYGVYMYFLFR